LDLNNKKKAKQKDKFDIKSKTGINEAGITNTLAKIYIILLFLIQDNILQKNLYLNPYLAKKQIKSNFLFQKVLLRDKENRRLFKRFSIL
tara:strand:+ start:296 stop:565 length:270 start_codon:yes stop_codon:yes gene_type:complete